jgi:hypothetical protein
MIAAMIISVVVSVMLFFAFMWRVLSRLINQ